MIDSSLTPYILAAGAGVLGLISYLFKQVFNKLGVQGESLVELRTAFKYYVEGTAKGTAMILSTPNPTPSEITKLFDKHMRGKLDSDGREQLIQYTKGIIHSNEADRDKKAAAKMFLTGLETVKMLDKMNA